MRNRGVTLVELLVAIAVGAAVMAAAFFTLRRGAKDLTAETQLALSRDQAARVLQGLSGELKGRPAAFLLPGASDRGAGLVVLSGTGWPVVPDGYGADRVRVIANAPDLEVGDPVALTSPTGEVFYLPALVSLSQVDAGRNLWELGFGSCVNPLRYVEGMRAYRAEVLTVARTAGGLELRGSALGTQQVVALRDFALRYVYSSPTGETILDSYEGAVLPDGSRLTALAFQATGTAEGQRSFTARIPLGQGSVEVRGVATCGGAPPPPAGLGVVTVVVDPEPPGGGDLSLLASGYTQTFTRTSTFRDVPEGRVEVVGRDVWTDSLTAWAPEPRSQEGILHTFAPLTFVVRYAKVPAVVTVRFSPGFTGSVRLHGLPGSPAVQAPESTIEVEPGVYTLAPETPVGGESTDGCLVRYAYAGQPVPLTLRSYERYTVDLAYQAESGCLKVEVEDRTQGEVLRNAGYKPTVRLKPLPQEGVQEETQGEAQGEVQEEVRDARE